ncbi:MAG: homoserine dehydrogenase [Firmicutes bacterium]|nr:homoserine dehydrogenase [Bacillota bacterium]
MKKLNVGILGLGTVGGGTYDILVKNHDLIQQRTGVSIEVVKILDLRKRPGVDESLFTTDPDEVLNNPDVDLIVETLGGIQPASSFMVQAMKNGKHVVTANKAAVAATYVELQETAAANGVKFLFEASVGGGIPVLTAIQGNLSGNNFLEVMGIVNGTTNYILTKMTEDGADYAEVLKDAQAKGFAEADPTADVEGIDVANKLCILIALLFGQYIAPGEIPTTGISKITGEDIAAAKAEGCKIKLIAHAKVEDGKVTCSVGPERIPESHPLAGVSNEFNAVYITGDMVDEVMLYGKGAGALPTGSAIVGDIISVAKEVK